MIANVEGVITFLCFGSSDQLKCALTFTELLYKSFDGFKAVQIKFQECKTNFGKFCHSTNIFNSFIKSFFWTTGHHNFCPWKKNYILISEMTKYWINLHIINSLYILDFIQTTNLHIMKFQVLTMIASWKNVRIIYSNDESTFGITWKSKPEF